MKKWVSNVNPIFRLPKEVLLQLANELSLVEVPCLVKEDLIDEFCEDLIDQRVQSHDDNSSDGSAVIKPASSNRVQL